MKGIFFIQPLDIGQAHAIISAYFNKIGIENED